MKRKRTNDIYYVVIEEGKKQQLTTESPFVKITNIQVCPVLQ